MSSRFVETTVGRDPGVGDSSAPDEVRFGQQGARQEAALGAHRRVLPGRQEQGDGSSRGPAPRPSVTEMSTQAGVSICINDMKIPESKKEIIRALAGGRRDRRRAVQRRPDHRRRALQQGRRYLGRGVGPGCRRSSSTASPTTRWWTRRRARPPRSRASTPST